MASGYRRGSCAHAPAVHRAVAAGRYPSRFLGLLRKRKSDAHGTEPAHRLLWTERRAAGSFGLSKLSRKLGHTPAQDRRAQAQWAADDVAGQSGALPTYPGFGENRTDRAASRQRVRTQYAAGYRQGGRKKRADHFDDVLFEC